MKSVKPSDSTVKTEPVKKAKKLTDEKDLGHKIVDSFADVLRHNTMDQLSRQSPEEYLKILYYTEAELFKHKRKMYPNSVLH